MKQQNGLKPTASILERAAEVYDFQAEFRRRSEGPPPAEQPQAAAPVAEPETLSPAAGGEAVAAEAPVAEPLIAEAAVPVPAPAKSRSQRARTAGPRSTLIDRARLAECGFIVPDGPVTGLAEEFRILKRQLLLGVSGESAIGAAKRQTILVCSAQPDEGKTFCAVNLALSMATEKDLDVLLIDGDFANPEIPELLGVQAKGGLAEALADPNTDPNDYIIQTDIGGLSILPAGKKANNITELLASARTRDVLRALTEHERKRVLIFDSPPALLASPACVLASHAGQIMMVVRADHTTESDLREALTLLSACQNVSLMLNRADRSVSGRRFGTYYGQGE